MKYIQKTTQMEFDLVGKDKDGNYILERETNEKVNDVTLDKIGIVISENELPNFFDLKENN